MLFKLALILLLILVVALTLVALWLLARRTRREFERRTAGPLKRALLETDQELAQFDQEIKQRTRRN